MKKLTAVELLVKVIKDSIDAEDGSVSINWLHDGTLDKANKLFEEQIIDALHYFGIENAQDYYNKTFNNGK